MTLAQAPTAPGRLGEAIDPAVTSTYLGELETWIRNRRTELDDLDEAALAANRQAELTTDIMLAMALWKAVSDRHQLLLATWDGGRVGVKERERLSTLIWGRLDATLDTAVLSRASSGARDAAGLAVSLPEACRLLDAMTGQLRGRLALDPSTDAHTARIRQLRASLERLRDQVELEPVATRPQAQQRWARLAGRVDDLVERVSRGGDVGGLIGPLEADLAVTERDLIVGNAQRRAARDTVVTARELREDLVAREHALAKLSQTCVDTVDPSPRYAIPDVDALGPVPNTLSAVNAYLGKLRRVSQALALAQKEYADALAGHEELTSRIEALSAKASALGVAADPGVAACAELAASVMAQRPTPIKVAEQLAMTYQTWIDWAAGSIRARGIHAGGGQASGPQAPERQGPRTSTTKETA